ncbi:MAG: 5-formyltetrahydrofolate cyclo-ligase [Nitrospirae bacterium]|nr:5-formyltetrahydrofolate cyclo-ligase [Candidatus Manganitrophaceae bacterium]
MSLQEKKQAIREKVWNLLEAKEAARFPGAQGRIPNFVGAERCAAHLDQLKVWQAARVIKINPDAPQRAIRYKALRDGKRLYMAVPRLRRLECFIELDSDRIGEKKWWEASSIVGAGHWGRTVTVEEMEPIDLIFCGSVAVSRDGGRIGKGEGYSDLEYALATEAGKVRPDTPIVTSVHPLQILDRTFPWAEHDIPVDFILTPRKVIVCRSRYPRPKGVEWDLLTEEKIEAIPALKEKR